MRAMSAGWTRGGQESRNKDYSSVILKGDDERKEVEIEHILLYDVLACLLSLIFYFMCNV